MSRVFVTLGTGAVTNRLTPMVGYGASAMRVETLCVDGA